MADIPESIKTGEGLLTAAEIAAALEAQGILAPADISTFAEYLFAKYAEQRQALVLTQYDALVSQMTGKVSAETLAEATRLAETAADSLLRTMAIGDIETMGAVIADGIEAGLNPLTIARNLDMVQGLDAPRAKALLKYRAELEASDMTAEQIARAEEREFQKLLKARRETIARTEAAKAVSVGNELDAKEQGAKWKVWQTTGDARVSDLCQANQAQGWIEMDKAFSSGHQTTPGHPNCRCSVSYSSREEPSKFAKASNERDIKKTEAAKSKGNK